MSRWFPEPLVLGVGDGPNPSTLDAMLASLDERLERHASGRGKRFTCVIGGSAVRYRIVPWSDELSSPAERRSLAAHAFQDAHGDASKPWAVREHASRHGRATLAASIDTVLLERIETLSSERRLHLISVQPSLMYAFNRHRASVDHGLAWFVWIEAHWITMLLQSGGEALHVRQLTASRVDLAELLEREWFALAIDAPPCPVYVACSSVAMARVGTTTSQGMAVVPASASSLSTDAWQIVELPIVAVDSTPQIQPASAAAPVPA